MSGTQFLKGLAIILIGSILLLNNFNILDWSVWYNIFRLWPLLLISLGISLIFRRRLAWLAPLVIVLGIIIGAGAGYMGIDLHLEGKIATETQTLQKEFELVPVIKETEQENNNLPDAEEDVDEPATEENDIEIVLDEEEMEGTEEVNEEETTMIPSVQKANLHLTYDIALFKLEFPTPLVYQCQVSYRYPEFKPIEDYSVADHEANIHIYHNSVTQSSKQFRNPNNNIDLKLNKEIVYEILIETGATTIDYNLAEFKVEKLTIKSGASDIKLIIPKYNGEIIIDSGVSKIDIGIPENIGATLDLDTGLSMKELDEQFIEQENNQFISKNYNSSEYKVNIDIDSGLSQINIYYL